MKRILILISLSLLNLCTTSCEWNCITTQKGIHHSSIEQNAQCDHDCYADRTSKMIDGYCTTCRHTRDVEPLIIVDVTEKDLQRKPKKKKPSLFVVNIEQGL